MMIRTSIGVHFQGQAAHGFAAAAKTLNVAVGLLDDLADLGTVSACHETHEAIQGKTAVQAAIGMIAGHAGLLPGN